MFESVWGKYISVVREHLIRAVHLSPKERGELMECLADAYLEIGDKAEAVAWRARAKAELIKK